MLRDVANTGHRNVIKKETETILKYEDLTLAIQRMWNVKTKAFALMIVLNGTISKSFTKHMCNLPGKHEIKEQHKQLYLPLHTCCGE